MPEPGWYTDPSGRYELRYWDGSRWTGDVRGQAPSVTAAQGATGPPADATTKPAEVTIAAADATAAAGLQTDVSEGHPLTRAERQASLHGAPRGKRRWLLIGVIVAVLVAGGVVAALSMSSNDTTVKTPQTTTTERHTSTTQASSTTSTSSAATTTTTPGATTTVAANASATSAPPASSAAALPPKVVTTGTWCTTAGDTGVNAKGTPMVCSATAKDGTPYPQPTWRPQ